MPTTDGTWRAGVDRDARHRWPVAAVVVASVFLFLGLALFLAVRRILGVLLEPLPVGQLLATAVLTMAWAWCVRAIGPRLVADEPRLSSKPARWLIAWTPLVAMLLVAVACSYPGARWGDWAVWLPALAGAWLLSDARIFGDVRVSEVAGEPRSPVAASPGSRGGPAVGVSEPATSLAREGQLLQQLMRFRTTDGRQAVEGLLLAELAAGEQTATLHVAFCPPFERLPMVRAEVVDGPVATVQIVQVLHSGVRIDVRLARPAVDATRVSVELLSAEREDEQGADVEQRV